MLEVGGYPYYLKQRILGDRGHLSNELSGRLLCDILHDNLKHIVLGHLSKENNYAKLAYETVKLEVTLADNEYRGEDLDMFVASRDTVSDINLPTMSTGEKIWICLSPAVILFQILLWSDRGGR